jgi:predicted ribosome quality control (RQC) complex YloA/Tae2 family protein
MLSTMAIDGIVLSKITAHIAVKLPFKITKINDLSDNELLLGCRSDKERFQLLISCHSVYNRLQITQQAFSTPQEPSALVMVLRKHIEDALVLSIKQHGLDRVVQFDLRVRNDLGDARHYALYVELMGKYANVILVDDTNKIIDALKRIPPFENNRRTIMPTAQYVPVDPHDKADPFTITRLDPSRSVSDQLHGVSPLLGREIEHRLLTQSYASIMGEITSSSTLYVYPKDFHIIPLAHLNETPQTYPLMEGLEAVYARKEEDQRIKQHTGDLLKFIHREIKRNEGKIIKLQEALEEALDCEKYRTYGDHLLAYQHLLTKGQSTLMVEHFESGEPLIIPLDEKLDAKGNLRKLFQKYQKGKKGQSHIQNQIELCTQEIDYFTGLAQQVAIANIPDALEIRQELSAQGYLKASTDKRKKPKTPAYGHVTLPNGIQVFYGKNNLQNDTVTFKLAQRNDTFMHVKGFHGAHVILHVDNPDEVTLRAGAQIALYYSGASESSTVGIDYCPVHQVKKIPGGKPGKVILGKYKTIYVDPDPQLINQLLKR